MNPKEIKDVLGLDQIENRHWSIVPCSAVTGSGLLEGINFIVEDIQQRILRGPAPARYEGPGDKLSAREALRRLRLADRRRRVRMRMSGSSSGHSDKPDVVFFPTDGSEGDGGGCQDATAGGGGFNTFSFLAFLLAGFNAISVVSNNNNNRENSRKSSHKSF